MGPKPNGNGKAFARPFATDTGGEMGYQGYDPGFQGDTKRSRAGRLRRLPEVRRDLLKAVFDANLKVMRRRPTPTSS